MRGFTFQQLAVILLVVLGLVVVIFLFISQSGNVSQSLSNVGEKVNKSSSALGSGIICQSQGGQCESGECKVNGNSIGALDCE